MRWGWYLRKRSRNFKGVDRSHSTKPARATLPGEHRHVCAHGRGHHRYVNGVPDDDGYADKDTKPHPDASAAAGGAPGNRSGLGRFVIKRHPEAL